MCYYLFQGKTDFYTIITKVKEDCCIRRGILNVFDRIIAINKDSVIHVPGKCVLQKLQTAHESSILLTVTYLESIPYYPKQLVEEWGSYPSSLELLRKSSQYCESFNSSSLDGFSRESSKGSITQNISLTLLSCDLSEKERGHRGLQNLPTEYETTFTQDENSESKLNNKFDSSIKCASDSEVHNGARHIKRGHSQVSGSSSNQSVNSDFPLLKKEGMRRAKENKTVRPFNKSGSTDSPDRAELEPLRTHDSRSPVPVGRLDKFSRTSRDAAVSMQDIMFEEQGLVPTHSGRYRDK